MPLSVPIYQLKRQARLMARDQAIPLYAALDRVAQSAGYQQWSQLAADAKQVKSGAANNVSLDAGKLILLAARPGQGKTTQGLKLLVDAMREGCAGVFFSLDYTELDVAARFHALGVDPSLFAGRFSFHDSDRINAAYIIDVLERMPPATIAVVDYLQLLDQRRENPELEAQVRALRGFALKHRMTLIFISQVDRRFELSGREMPDPGDIRLPNPVDLKLFDNICFLHGGRIEVHTLS